MIAARQIAFGKAGRVPTAADYIQDGLVGMWDGIENAGWGVRDATATVWKDLMGENDLVKHSTASNPIWSENAFCGETNVNHTLNSTNALTLPLSATGATIEIVAYRGPVNSQWFVSNRQGSQKCFQRFKYDNEAFYLFNANAKLVIKDSASLRYTAVTADDTSAIAYVEGAQTGITNGYFVDYIFNGYRMEVASALNWHSSAFYLWTGSGINAIRIYSRALTAEEVAYNYLIDRARFKLA